MTDLATKIKIMQAALDGKEIKYKDHSKGWSPASTPLWDWNQWDYRIKPEPMEFWMNVYSGDAFEVCSSEEIADRIKQDNCVKTIKVREVIE